MTLPDRTILAADAESAARLRELLYATDDSTWQAGSAEPWIADVLASLIVANDVHTAVEVGGFMGYTSLRLARALARLPHDTSLTVCELDPARAAATQSALTRVGTTRVRARVVNEDSLRWIPTLQDRSVDFVWLDGNHEKPHVLQELHALLPKMAPGGIIAGHDVFGSCDLQEVFALVASQTARWRSMSLDLPRLGPAGGIGLLQAPR